MASKSVNKRLASRFGKKYEQQKKTAEKKVEQAQKSSKKNKNTSKVHVPAKQHKGIYHDHYKKLLLIPFLILLAAIVVLIVHTAQTGDFINRGISLKGGTAITIAGDVVDLSAIEPAGLESALEAQFPQADIDLRLQRSFGELSAMEITVDITEDEQIESFKSALIAAVPGLSLDIINKNISISGSNLGEAFFRQIIRALIIAFILMGIVVFIQFKVPVPSLAVILAVLSDIIITLAVVNLLGMKLSTAGIAAFLMLIGYSVDTDILLSTRVLKNKEGTVYERVITALKTGLTMNITTLVAVSIALVFTSSEVIRQIMTILVIGLIVDMINTWLQNAGILRWYLEKQAKKGRGAHNE